MSVVLDLSEDLGIEEPVIIDETNRNIRSTWLIEKFLTENMIHQSEKHNSIQKQEKFINQQKEFISQMIDYLIDILDIKTINAKDNFLDDVSYFDTMNAVTKITAAILHIDPVSVDEDDFDMTDYKKKLKQKYFFLDDAVKDFDYNEQQILTNLHIAPSIFEKEDYYRMNEVLSAMSPDERPTSGSAFLNRLNMSREDANDALAKK